MRMFDGLAGWLFDSAGLTPHGFCLLWEPGLIWTYAVSDMGIGIAYFTIPVALGIFAQRRSDLVFRPIVWLFASFILLCGTTHLLDVLTLWVPAYGVEAVVKAATAAVSIVTAIILWRLLPEALSLPSRDQLEAANAALRESEARYRTSFEYSPVPVHTIDGNGVITGVSNSWLALFGYSSEEVVGRHLSEFSASDSESWVQTDRARLIAEGEVSDMERRFLRRDGSAVDALVSARLERRQEAVLIVCVLIDITARRQAEEALRASEERFRQAQKMEAVGQLTGGIAHDFNNMLQGIAGSLELMETRIAQGRPERVGHYIGTARQAVDRAAGLTHRMLAFARRQALQPRAVEPDLLVGGMEELIRRTMGPSIQVKRSLHDGVWLALCDANQLESALLNLAINARDAMPDGGVLTISTADRSLAGADLADQNVAGQDGAEPGDYVEIAVTDTGMGMTPDMLTRVFEPFFTTKPIGRGTGLGLSQVYGFVRQSGGFVRLESEPGHGTSVRLYLPRHDEADAVAARSPQHAGADPHAASGIHGRTVLIVEDEASVRGMIADMLRDRGCSVLEAADGPAGLRIVQSPNEVDLLITDIGLPGLNGRQLADAARERRPDLPVLLITGYAGTALEDAELPPGMEVMHKPFTFEMLVDHAHGMLEASSERPIHPQFGASVQ